MPNPRYYPQQREQKPTARDQALAGLNAPEQQSGMDPGALMQMLTHLYGIQQGGAEMGLHQQELALKQHLADGEDAYHTAQSQALQRHMPEGFQYLPPEMQNFAFGQAYPEWAKKQADDAATKAAQKQALMEQDKAMQAGAPAQVPSEGLGANIHNAVVNLPEHLQNMDTRMTDSGTGFWQGLFGYHPDAQKETDAHAFMQQAAQMPNQPTHDPIGDWVSKMFGGMTGPKAGTVNPTPPPVYKPVQFMPQERPLRTGF